MEAEARVVTAGAEVLVVLQWVVTAGRGTEVEEVHVVTVLPGDVLVTEVTVTGD